MKKQEYNQIKQTEKEPKVFFNLMKTYSKVGNRMAYSDGNGDY